MKLETLYKRGKAKQILYWQIEVRFSELTGRAQILKESGQLGTNNPIQHVETLKIGKQKRSVKEQADFQAKSDWKKKHDEGYKTLAELGIDPQGEHISTEWPVDELITILQLRLPEFNTDAQGNVKPMLATDWKKIKTITYPCICEPKFDGVRCLMIIKTSGITFLSRTGKEYTSLDHIADGVKFYIGEQLKFTEASTPHIDTIILDGEIYSDELNFQEIVSAVKAYKENSHKLKFRVYDIVSEQGQMHRRMELLLITQAINSHLVEIVNWTTVGSDEEVKAYHDQYVSQGYEGAILRMRQGKYAQGQRSRELLKVKEFDETEFAFKNFEFGQRGVEDLIAVCWDITGDKEFRAKVVGTLKDKVELYAKNDFAEGKSFTIKHFGYTEDGLPRFPIGKGFRNYE